MKAPIILFVYNRPNHTRQTLNYLKKNIGIEDSILYIISDGAKKETWREVNEVRQIIHEVQGFKQIHIIEREENWGIEKSEIDAISMVVKKYGRAIMLEDDLIPNPGFLDYMNNSLELYEDKKQVYYIAGYNYMRRGMERTPESFFLKVPAIWGWGTWKDRWLQFEAEPKDITKLMNSKKMQKRFNCEGGCRWYDMLIDQGNNLTWDICWYWTVFKNNGLVLYPRESLIINIGLDGSGIHCGAVEREEEDYKDIDVPIFIKQFPKIIDENLSIRRKMSWQLREQYNPGYLKRIVMRLQNEREKIRKRRKSDE